jgi:hypothetical protein
MTAKTLDGALAAEAARGAEYIASIRAEGFRAGLDAAADYIARVVDYNGEHLAAEIRSLPVPEIDR